MTPPAGADEGQERSIPLNRDITLPALPDGSRVTCRGEAIWCPVRVVPRDLDGEGDLTLPVFPAQRVTGVLAGPERLPVRGVVQALVDDPAGKATVVELRQDLEVEDGRLAFQVPHRSLDLRLSFPGAAPIYLWDVPASEVTPGAPLPHLALGTLRLRPGGSVNGWVRKSEDELPLVGAEVAASPLGSGPGTEPIHTARASSDDRGFFQVFGLAPGAYRLEVTADGRAPGVLEPVEVDAGAETLVGVVPLSPPLRLEVQVHPARHPTGEPWTLALFPSDRRPGEEPVTVSVDRDGMASVPGLRPTEYRVKVQNGAGETFLTESQTLTGDGWLVLDVPLVEVRGTVHLGEEPLTAEVRLEAGGGDRVELSSDEEGALGGWMTRPERDWMMATVTWSRDGTTFQRLVDLVPEVRDDAVTLEIELPAGRIEGRVVDLHGRPQRDVPVKATPAGAASRFTEVEVRTDSRGRFELQALDAGTWYLQAGGGGGPTSEVVALPLADGDALGEVELVVRETRALTVVVTAGEHPVVGADLHLTTPDPAPVSLHGTTDGRGEASFQVPRAADRAVVTILAPSPLLWSGCLALQGQRLSLEIPAGTDGTLSLVLVGRSDLPPVLGGRQVLLTGDGGYVPLGILLGWSRLRTAGPQLDTDGPRIVQTVPLPAVAAGTYAATWTGVPDGVLAEQACRGGAVTTAWTPLPPGGRADLRVDATEIQETRLRELRSKR